jgi:hypothetical protein
VSVDACARSSPSAAPHACSHSCLCRPQCATWHLRLRQEARGRCTFVVTSTMLQGTLEEPLWLCMHTVRQTTGLPAVLGNAAPRAAPHANGDLSAAMALGAACLVRQPALRSLMQRAGSWLAGDEALDIRQLLRGTLQERLQLTNPLVRQEMLHAPVGCLQDGCALMAVAECPCTEKKRGHGSEPFPALSSRFHSTTTCLCLIIC